MQRCAISWEHVWILSGPSAPTYVSHIWPTWHRRNQGTCQASSLAGLETSAKFVIPHDFAPGPSWAPTALTEARHTMECLTKSQEQNNQNVVQWLNVAFEQVSNMMNNMFRFNRSQKVMKCHEMSWNVMNSIFRWFQKLSAQTTYTWTLAKLAIYSRSVNAGRDVPQQAFALCRKRPQK